MLISSWRKEAQWGLQIAIQFLANGKEQWDGQSLNKNNDYCVHFMPRPLNVDYLPRDQAEVDP